MSREKAKIDSLTTRKRNCQRAIDHLNAEMLLLQSQIDDPNNSNDAELEAVLAKAEESLFDQLKKMAKLTNSAVPPLDPVDPIAPAAPVAPRAPVPPRAPVTSIRTARAARIGLDNFPALSYKPTQQRKMTRCLFFPKEGGA